MTALSQTEPDAGTELAGHREELTSLTRVQTRISANTPWGSSHTAVIYAEGVTLHATASHGGFHLSPDRNGLVTSSVRVASGWYEEDIEWAVVAQAFPDLFTRYERQIADHTIRNTWPDWWEELHGRALAPGESWRKDRTAFDHAHADHWVVISAIYSDHHPDMTEVIATKGGSRSSGGEEQHFLVSRQEYATRGRFGFVIDEDRHGRYDGPSSFVGWAGRAA